MNRVPSGRQIEMESRVAREESGDRRTIMWIHRSAAVVLIASTLLAWMNHPRVEGPSVDSAYGSIREVSHTIGLLTRPAGILALVIGVVALATATYLRSPRRRAAWSAFGLALAAIAVVTVEIVQLLLGRRNWLNGVHAHASMIPSPLSHAIGAGVWLAAVASVTLFANASTYLWLEYILWRKSPTKELAASRPTSSTSSVEQNWKL